MTIKPLADKVLLAPMEAEETTASLLQHLLRKSPNL